MVKARRLEQGKNAGWEIAVRGRDGDDRAAHNHELRRDGGHLHGGRPDAVQQAGDDRIRAGRIGPAAAPLPNANEPRSWTKGDRRRATTE